MKRRQLTSPVFQGRRLFLLVALLVLIGVLLLRAVWLEVFQQQWLQQQADKRQIRVVTVPAYRGMILDRNGDPMAISSPVASLWCNPQDLLKAREELRHRAAPDNAGAGAGLAASGAGLSCSSAMVVGRVWVRGAGYLVAAFLAAPMVLRGPLRVRALVEVRWPRTGRPLRCRMPR